MASANSVFLMGNLTRDPMLRYLPSGQAVVSFSVAVNRVYITQSGEKKEETAFVPIVVWGKRAETCNQFLSKGSPVFVEGRLRSRSWEAQDGTKRSAIEVIARNVQFLGKLKERLPAVYQNGTRPAGQAGGPSEELHPKEEAPEEEAPEGEAHQEPAKQEDVPF